MNDDQDPVVNADAPKPNDFSTGETANGDIGEILEENDPASEIERLQHEAADQQDKYQRAVADLANYRRRKEQETTRLIRQAKDQMLSKFLPVVDDFDRAIKTAGVDQANKGWIEGFSLIEKKLWSVFETEGVRRMASVGEPFDPKLHDAVMVDEGSSDPDTVVEEFQRGYYIGERVLRPAVVKVGSGTGNSVNGE